MHFLNAGVSDILFCDEGSVFTSPKCKKNNPKKILSFSSSLGCSTITVQEYAKYISHHLNRYSGKLGKNVPVWIAI